MKQAWINKKEKEKQEKVNNIIQQIRQSLLDFGKFSDSEIEELINNAIFKIKVIGTCDPGSMIIPYSDESSLNKRFCFEDNLLKDTINLARKLPYYELFSTLRINYNRYLDSIPVEFYGDIIITDPCYIVKDCDWSNYCDDFYESDRDKLIKGSIVRDTIYGDWSCTTYNKNTKEPIGNFCSDSGLVGVFNLDKVLEYNPEFEFRKHTATLIKNFKGKVYFNIKHDNKYDDYSVHVIGKGYNIKTNEPIEFITYQTGF